ncbi:dymeclin [Drosophila grimshawi]|uniref:Dymeclin n=1 Tax=Drosophila grimshawi TaxID=7222 RepID=B4J5D5_DROGR|nr:dymeclin [Drosophila grimshawi]EDW01777.1 GH20269 [Drosophila grimshawi]
MGINVSRNADLASNEWLQRFVGRHHIAHDDEAYWNGLLNYNIVMPENSQDQLSLDSRLETLCQSFIGHNLKTGNFGSLVTVFLEKASELLSLSDQESNMHVWQTFNALFIIRTLIKYINETGSEFQLLQHFEAMPSAELLKAAEEQQQHQPPEMASIAIEASEHQTPLAAIIVDGAKFETFIDALVNLIVVIPVKEFTYHLHLESVNTLITLLSVHLFAQQLQHQQQQPQPPPTDKSIVFRTIYKCQHANVLMSALLHFVARMVEVPHTMFGSTSAGSFVFGIAESLLSILTFRKQQDVLKTSNATGEELSQQFRNHYPLANQSLLLILILTNHCTAQDNAYRASLFGCADSKDSPKQANGAVSFQIDFSAVYETLCRIVTIDQATLLLYLLLHRNERFYRFVMQQPDLEQLVIPILQTLYNAPDSNSHHIYMSLIVLLILSEDEGFNKNVHTILLKNISWYTERTISEISLGGILILIVIRTIQYNMLKMRDKYLHTNCLAALANMSGHFRALHPYVAQRLVSLFETLARKHTRLDAQLKEPADSAVFVNVSTTPEDMMQDLTVLEEVLRMVLEILNSCLTNQLVYCPNLVYTLLYKRSVFEGFRSHHAFQDVIQNIDMVVGFFSSRLQRVQEQRGELGVNEVLEVISKGASQWSSDRLRKFPDLKFKYVEEDAPEEFFIPYVWTLVCKYGCVHFSSESIKSITTDIAC